MNSLDKFKKVCKVVDTPKIYYSKYSYRAEFSINGAHLIGYTSEKNYSTFNRFESLVDARIQGSKRQIERNKDNYMGYRWNRIHTATIGANAKLLFKIGKALDVLKGKIRTRVEGSGLCVYVETEEQLLSLLNGCRELRSYLKEMQRPATADSKLKLEENVIFTKEEPKYKWKVQLKTKHYKDDVKEQIWNYLENFPDSVILPKGVKERLNPKRDKPQSYNHGNYYVNDESSLLFLKMIAPDFVFKIFKLEKKPE